MTNNNQVSASIVFLLPALILMMVFLALVGLSTKVWAIAMTNREFRDNVLQLQTSAQNTIEAVVGDTRTLLNTLRR